MTISSFARTVELAPSALRYYDEVGLLPPAEVDSRSGYRYYTPELERRARLIARMRAVGVPVETMRMVLQSTAEQAVELLRAFAKVTTESALRTANEVEGIAETLLGSAVGAGLVVTEIDGPELATALIHVSMAAASDPSSRLAVVLLDVIAGGIVVVATNRSWMARWSVPRLGDFKDERRVIVPVTAIPRLWRWLENRGSVTLSVSADATRLRDVDEAFDVETVEDHFPTYQLTTHAQEPPAGRATIDCCRLLGAIADQGKAVRLTISDDRITVGAYGSVEGSHLEATTSGSRIILDFSTTVLRSALASMVGNEVILSYSTPDHPVEIRPTAQRNSVALLMPSSPVR